MKTFSTVALAVLAGTGIGVGLSQALHAQAKPHAYAIVEIDVSNEEAFTKDYLPVAAKAIEGAGGKYIARGGKTVAIEGPAPKRLTLIEFENLEKAQAAFSSATYKEGRKIGDKYGKWHTVAIEGLAK
jgi:uncharacterized protein (DUF1330 family)